MDKYIINGGNKLFGELTVQGAKNAVLPLFAAAILAEGTVKISNCPRLIDVDNMAKILISLGVEVIINRDYVEIDPKNLCFHEIPSKLAKELRSSIFLLGAVLAKLKKAKVAYPGGCDIGLRPIDIHLKGLKDLNVKIIERYGYINCDASKIRSGAVTLDYPSVGATENVMLASCLLDGVTTISNAAREPEIVDLQNFINAMGGKIYGAGTSHITIIGVKKLTGTEYEVMPDRIVTGTYILATTICGGDVLLKNCKAEDVKALITGLQRQNAHISYQNREIRIKTQGRLEAFESSIDTQPYPGFPTDLQAPLMALSTVMEGTTVITENIFETRFKHVPELRKMGANISIKDRVAIIKGVKKLVGADCYAMDLRGGAGLVIAGLAADGTTTVNDIKYIERGYENLDKALSSLGASIKKQ